MRRERHGAKTLTGAKRLLIILMTAIVTVALGVTCALCFGTGGRADVVGQGASVAQSATNRGALTGDGFYNQIVNGTSRAGDYVEYGYTGSIVSVNLYPGSYRLEVWGAQGGNDANGVGGAGGYTFGEYTVTAKTTVYVVVGGRGASGATGKGGGYNGGGNAGNTGSSGAGGGATHIGTANALLNANKNASLVVAGGGGGGGNSYGQVAGGAGGGGNNNGAAGAGCNGGTQSGVGSGNYAGSGCNGGNRNGDGGGGGGGWFGGGASAGDGGGAGGSGHINTTYITHYGGTNGARTEHGFARITYLCKNSALGALTGDGLVNSLNEGKASAGSHMDYGAGGNGTTTGAIVSVNLPIGTYRLEVFGGQGGNESSMLGGNGGYTYGEYTVTAATTVYIVVGGRGATNATNTGGGYNGGGNAGNSSTSGAGGGATHIGTANALLNANKNAALVVAGGGGGAGAGSGGAFGGGGNNAGNNGSGAVGGSATAAGTGGNAGSGCLGGNRNGNGGGGGGGWFGGGASTSDNGGAGGSGKIAASIVGGGGANGVRPGAGFARITIINAAPVAKTVGGVVVATAARGDVNIAVPVGTIAKDPDGTANVYYSNGTASNYDTCTNVQLYLNSACTVSASNYVAWNATATPANAGTTFNITRIKRYPVAGVDYQTADGVLTLYTKVRDDYVSNTKRGVGNVPFKINITNNAVAPKPFGTPYNEFTYTNDNGSYTYRVGLSTSADGDADYTAAGTGILNPAGEGKKTVFITQPLALWRTEGFTIYVDDIFADADTAWDIVGFKPIQTSGDLTSYYRLEYTPDDRTNGLSSAVTIKPTSLQPDGTKILTLTLVAQESEIGTKALVGNGNSDMTLVIKLSSPRPYFASATASNNIQRDEPIITLDIGETKSISTAEFLHNLDNSVPLFDTTSGSVKVPGKDYMCVSKENTLIELASTSNYNKGGAANIAANTSTTGEGKAQVWADVYCAEWTSAAESATAVPKYSRMVAPTGSAEANYAWVTYSYTDNTTISFTAAAASHYMYRSENRLGDFYVLVKVVDPLDPYDNGMWYPIAIKVNATAPREPSTVSNFTLSFAGDSKGTTEVDGTEGTGETIYLTPLSYVDGSGVTRGIGAPFISNVGTIDSQAKPFLIDDDTYQYPTKGAKTAWSSELNDITLLDAPFTNAADSSAKALAAAVDMCNASDFFKVEVVPLYTYRTVFDMLTPTQIDKLPILPLSEAEETDAPIVYKGMLYKFYGLKVTAIRSTDDYFFQFDVKVVDSHLHEVSGSTGQYAGNSAATNADGNNKIRVFIKVANRAISLRRDPKDSNISKYPFNTSPNGKYVKAIEANNSYINYTVRAGNVIYITPYDIAYDFDNFRYDSTITVGSPLVNYINPVSDANITCNSNPADSGFAATAADITRTFSVKRTPTPITSISTLTPEDVRRGELSFTNMLRFNEAAKEYDAYISAEEIYTFSYENSSTVYALPCIKITAKSRTTANIPFLRFSVTDGQSTVDFAIAVTVENAAPELNKTHDYSKYKEYYYLTAGTADTKNAIFNKIELNADNLAYDRDGDPVSFVSGGVRVVAYDESNLNADGTHYFEYVIYDAATLGYVGWNTGDPGTPIALSDYINAVLTKGTGDGYIGQDVLSMEGLSSTQMFDIPVMVEFTVTDSYRAQVRTEALYIRVEVINSTPAFVADDLTKNIFANESYTWYMPYDTAGQKAVPRYIVNDVDLYNSDAISASEANKKLLFADSDSKQTVLLSPKNGRVTANLTQGVSDYVPDPISGSIASPITVDSFVKNRNSSTTAYEDAAVIVSRTYGGVNPGSTMTNKNFDVTVQFFEKNPDSGKFNQIPAENIPANADISDYKYWAICIVDNLKTDSADFYTQIAISVKDDHYENRTYRGDDVTGLRTLESYDDGATKPVDSSIRVFNFYFKYQKPGVRVMQEYYRTDGNKESKIKVEPVANDIDARYPFKNNNARVVDVNYLPSGYVSDYTIGNQDSLATAKFTDDFKYLYFVNIYEDTLLGSENMKGSGTYISASTPHIYPSNQFLYKPLSLSGNDTAVVPMSYLAMPKAFQPYNGDELDDGGNLVHSGTDWDDTSKVVFGNMPDVMRLPDASTTYKYYRYGNQTNGDPNYLAWVGNYEYEKKIFDNLTLTYGKETYSGYEEIKGNPYININFIANKDRLQDENYINFSRSTLELSGTEPNYSLAVKSIGSFNKNSKDRYYEDKYGFEISRKKNSARVIGKLKLSVDVRSSSGADFENLETVSLDIYLQNSIPDNFNSDKKYNEEVYATVRNLSVASNTGDKTSGAFVELIKHSDDAYDNALGKTSTAPIPDNSPMYTKITYQDADKTDIVKFFIPSSSGKALKDTPGITDEVLAHFTTTADADARYSYDAYFGDDFLDDVENTDTTIGDFIPNEGYEKFFTVSPAMGSSQFVQIIPKLKTALNIVRGKNESEADFNTRKAQILETNHLKDDGDGKGIYYPFKILAYDDCNNSGFVNGRWKLIVLKVYIANSTVSSGSVNEIKLTKGVDYSFDVSGLLSDADIPMLDRSLVTKDMTVKSTDPVTKYKWQEDWDALGINYDESASDIESNGTLVYDLLEMPLDNSGNVVFSAYLADGVTSYPGTLPITITASGSTLKFVANSAFKIDITVKMTFKDTAPTPSQKLVEFKVKYANEVPTKNATTYNGMNNIDIVMKRGDSFALFTADTTTFEADEDGGFNSPGYFYDVDKNGKCKYYNKKGEVVAKGTAGATPHYKLSNYPNGKTAEELRDDFIFFTTSDYDEAEFAARHHEDGFLGQLILGSDDAPSTLRFVESGTKFDSASSHMFDVDFTKTLVANEYNSASKSPAGVVVTALGVATNAMFSVMITDGENGHQSVVTLRVTVLPTAPHVKETLPESITKVEEEGVTNTYSISLKYKESRTYMLSEFMDDIDTRDYQSMYLPAEYSGSCFKVTNPGGLSAVSATVSDKGFSEDMTFTATDFIPTKGEYSQVAFRVSDSHGAICDEITFRVYIEPREAESAAGDKYEDNFATLDIKSYSSFYVDGLKETFMIVSDDKTQADLVFDEDVKAPSARYDVAIYALLMNRDDVFHAINMDTFNDTNAVPDKSELLLLSVENGVSFVNATTDVYAYVSKFFDLMLTNDGKTLTVEPKAAIVKTDGTLDKIRLYFDVKKRYDYGDGAAKTMNAVPAVGHVSVSNSLPVAVQNSAINFGYPMIEDGEDTMLRNDDFLSFTGMVGDSVTWDISSPTSNRNFGLFYDFDMINVNASNEKLECVKFEVGDLSGADACVSVGENFIEGGKLKPNDPVLSVSTSAANDKLTITINRKVKEQYRKLGPNNTYKPMVIPIVVSCADRVSKKAQKDYVTTVIYVTIVNDPVSFNEISVADGFAYTIMGSDDYGFDMYMSIPRGDSVTVDLKDIIKDADKDFDKYSYKTTTSPCIEPHSIDSPAAIAGVSGTLFEYYTQSSSNSYYPSSENRITFKCVSAARGSTVECYIMLSDSDHDSTLLTLHLTVGNTAPTAAAAEKREITVMGLEISEEEVEVGDDSGKSLVFYDNIINYVEDINPKDKIDVTKDYNAAETRASNTYIYIDSFVIYTAETAMSKDDKPVIYGPAIDNSTDTDGAKIETACTVSWTESNTHQMFGITVTPGVYGRQKVVIKVYDGGYLDGSMADPPVTDELSADIELYITVACPINGETMPTFEIADQVTRRLTPDILLNTKEEPHKADGYSIVGLTSKSANLRTQAPASVQPAACSVAPSVATEEDWRVTALTMTGTDDSMEVTFRVGNKTLDPVTIPVRVTENHCPEVILTDSTKLFSQKELLEGNITMPIKPEDWFLDPDIDDEMHFVGTPKVAISSYATATINQYSNTIDIKFKGKGMTVLSVDVSDASRNVYTYDITIGCMDMPELGVWGSFVAYIESNTLIFWLIIAGILLLLILLIIILVVVHKKRKIRAEIEALLNSEAELNEEMLRLSSMSNTMYQSYGYLPPTAQTMNDPGLMLGSGAAAPNVNSLQLGVGTGQTSGVVNDVTNLGADTAPRPGMTQQAPGAQQQQQGPAADGFDPNNF